MFRKQGIAAIIVLLAAIAAYGQGQTPSMKGYEMYSWKVKGRWHYSLLQGTNRAKNYSEITSRASERIGIDALEAELKKLPRGEIVVWRSSAHPGIVKPREKGAPILELPSRKRIKRIKAHCDKLGIKLTLA